MGRRKQPVGGGELANRFLAAFNTIDRELANIAAGDFRQTFRQQVYIAARRNSYVRKYAEDLFQYADLRNAIVHTRRANSVIAEPHEDVVLEIEKIARLIANPPLVADVMTLRPRSVGREASVGEVLQLFRKYNISRCPIVSSRGVEGLITAKCIVKWLESVAEESLTQTEGEKVSVESAFAMSVGGLLGYSNDNEYAIVGRRMSAAEVAEKFQQGMSDGRYVQALLVTVDGSARTPLVGIITPSDLPRLFEADMKNDMEDK